MTGSPVTHWVRRLPAGSVYMRDNSPHNWILFPISIILCVITLSSCVRNENNYEDLESFVIDATIAEFTYDLIWTHDNVYREEVVNWSEQERRSSSLSLYTEEDIEIIRPMIEEGLTYTVTDSNDKIRIRADLSETGVLDWVYINKRKRDPVEIYPDRWRYVDFVIIFSDGRYWMAGF